MANVKRVGTGNPPPPVPHLFESRKGEGCSSDLQRDEVFKKYCESTGGNPDSKYAPGGKLKDTNEKLG